MLQVWLDEAGLEFDHADGASGGNLNLAMWCQGMSGHADRGQLAHVLDPSAASASTGAPGGSPGPTRCSPGRFRRNVLRAWGLDWARIRATEREATFNVYDFTTTSVVHAAADMDEDMLMASISIPMWFPPVRIDGHTYLDAVFLSDANLEEAIDRGADELWVIWTVSERASGGRASSGIYFGIIEAWPTAIPPRPAAHRAQQRRDRRRARRGEFGRHIEVKMLRGRGAHPLPHEFHAGPHDRRRRARRGGGARWCAAQGIAYTAERAPVGALPGTSVRFTEEMAGRIHVGSSDPLDAERQRGSSDVPCMFHLTIDTGDLATFVTSPADAATAVGWVDSPAFGGRCEVEHGEFNLFVDQDDHDDKRMLYLLWFTDRDGRPRTLTGHKVIHDDHGLDLWRDTTTLYTTVLDGHVTRDAAVGATVAAAGVLRIRPLMFARQLTTFRASGPTLWAQARAMGRFGRLFSGALWDVYLTEALPASPF